MLCDYAIVTLLSTESLFVLFPDGSLLGHCCEGLASHTISALPVCLIFGEVYGAT